MDRQAESIPDVNEACLQFYDISKGQTVLLPWSEVTSSLQNYHDYAVDTLTDVYAKYCPQLLGSMKEFVAEVLAGDVYVEGLSETIVDSEIVTASDITNQWSGHEYTFSNCIVRGPLNCRKCGYKGEYVYEFFQEINFPCAFEFSEVASTGGYVSYSCYRLANGAIYPYVFKYSCTCPACGYSFTQGYNGYWLINFSTNVPIFSSYEAVETYFRTGAGYENALNFGTSIDDNITANTDLPPFYKTWQQEQWERVANAPDIGIGSYGYGVDSNGTEWADDIPWVGLDSLRQYAEAIPDTYDKVVDNVLSGNYDSNKDIPETYTDAWEDAVGDTWANVQIADSLGSGGGGVTPGSSKKLDEMTPAELVKLTPQQFQEALPEGWTYNQSPDGRYIHIRDVSGKYRIRIDPPDNVTNYNHIHIFDVDGNALDINGNIVPDNSPDAHIPR